jgi:branched-chain amino acid transport system ATP-binding protein
VLFTIAGGLAPVSGHVDVLGSSIAGVAPHNIARRGLAMVPENRGLFTQLSVAENLRLRRRKGSSTSIEQALELFPKLAGILSRKVGLLSGGEQQMLALAGALVAGPRVLIIDEMSLGLAPILVDQLLALIPRIASEQGVAVLLVEQHVHACLAVANRAYVLNHGRVVLEGSASELLANPHVLETAYLGAAVVS